MANARVAARMSGFLSRVRDRSATGELDVEVCLPEPADRMLPVKSSLGSRLLFSVTAFVAMACAAMPQPSSVQLDPLALIQSPSVIHDAGDGGSSRADILGVAAPSAALDEVEARPAAVAPEPMGLRASYPDDIRHPTQTVKVHVLTGWKSGRAISEERSLESIHPADRVRLSKEAAESAGLKRLGKSWTDVYAFVSAETGWVPRNGVGLNKVVSRGLAQLEPATARMYGVVDPDNPRQAVGAVAKLIGDAVRWTNSQRHADPSAALSVYYNTSSALRRAWDGVSLDVLPAPTLHHIRNRAFGASEARVMDRKFGMERPAVAMPADGRRVGVASGALAAAAKFAGILSPGTRSAVRQPVSEMPRRSVAVRSPASSAGQALATVDAIKSSLIRVAASVGRAGAGSLHVSSAPLQVKALKEFPTLTDVLVAPGDEDADKALLWIAAQIREKSRQAGAVPHRHQMADVLMASRSRGAICQSIADADDYVRAARDRPASHRMAA